MIFNNKIKFTILFLGIILAIIFISTQVNACSCNDGTSPSGCTWGVDCDRCGKQELIKRVCYDKIPKKECDSCFDGWDTRQKTCFKTTSERVCETCSRRVRVPNTCSRKVTNTVCGTCWYTDAYGRDRSYSCNCHDESSWEDYDCSYNDWEDYDCNCRTVYTDTPYDCSEKIPRYVDCNCVDYFEYTDYDCSYWKTTNFDCGCRCATPTQKQIDDYNKANKDPSKGADSEGKIIDCESNLFDSRTGRCKYSANNCVDAGYAWDGTECRYTESKCIAVGSTWNKKTRSCDISEKDCVAKGKQVVDGFCVGESKADDCVNAGYNYDNKLKICVYNKEECSDKGLGWVDNKQWQYGGACSVSLEECPTSFFYNNICYPSCPIFDKTTQKCYRYCPNDGTFIPGGICEETLTGSGKSTTPCIPKTKAEACGAIECEQSVAIGCGGTIECGPCPDSNQVCMSDYKCCTPTTPETCGNNYGSFSDECDSNYSCVCNGIADCVHKGKCYSSGTLLDHNNDGKIDLCSYSKWKDLTLNVEFISPTPYDELWVSRFNMMKAKISQSYLKDLKFNFNNGQIVQINLSSLIFGASFDNNLDYKDWVNNKEMEIKGSVRWEQDGKYGGAVYFNGVSSYLDIKGWANRLDNEESRLIINEGYVYNTPENDVTNSFTFGGWIKATETHEIDTENIIGTSGTTGQKYVFGASHYGGADNAGAGLSIGTNGISVYEHGDSYMPAIAVYNGNIGTGWNHVMVVYDNKNAKIYLNGELVKTGFPSPQKQKIYAPTKIGAGTYGSFKGYVDEINIFNRALNANEIKSLYQSNIKKISEDEWEFSVPMNSTSMPYGYKEYNITVCDTKKCEFERGFFYLVENNIPSIEVVEIDTSNFDKKLFNVTNVGDVPLSYEEIKVDTKSNDITATKRIVSSITKNSVNPKVIKKGDSYVVELTFNHSNVGSNGRITYNDYTTREFSDDKEQLYISYKDLELNFVLDNNVIYRKDIDLTHYIDCSGDENTKFLIGGEEFYCSCNIICEKGQICPCVKKIDKINILGSGGIPGIINIIFDATGTKENG